MARPREFDEISALDAAMIVFWQQGYANTSIQDLEYALGVGRTSIYAAFGNKEELFLLVLDRYNEVYSQSSRETLTNEPDIRAALIEYFRGYVVAFTNPDLPLGCLFTNTSTEIHNLSPSISRKIQHSISETETVLYRLLRHGQITKQIDPDIDPRSFARYFMAVVKGLAILAKSSVDTSVLEEAVDALFVTIDRTFGERPKNKDNAIGALGGDRARSKTVIQPLVAPEINASSI